MRKLFLIIPILTLYFCQACQLKQEHPIISIENDHLAVQISAMGAELWNIRHKKTGREYLWQGDPEYWADRSPVMFPVCVRFKDDRYTYRGIPYEMPFLGIALRSSFKVTENQSREKAVFEFISNEETLQYYPFPFRLEITFSLKENRLVQQFVVENTGTDSLYFALGDHPGFRFPMEDGKTRGDFCLSFPEALTLTRPEIVNSLLQPLSQPLLENENRLAFDDPRIPGHGMFLKDPPVRQIGIGLIDQPPFISVDLGNFPNVNIWTPPGMPFVCIEPMAGHQDLEDSPLAIEEKPYLLVLPAGASKTYSFSIIVHEESN